MNDISKLLRKKKLSKDDIAEILSVEDAKNLEKLKNRAFSIKKKLFGNKIYIRGIIEFSNICKKNCFYCGIRRDNRNIKRYSMTEDEIVNSSVWAYRNGYGSVVLQSGEREDAEFVYFVDRLIRRIKKETSDDLRIVLCVGEQEREVYKMWRKSGADRYLLRIETSSKELYRKLHPEDHSYDRRVRCVEYLKELGYQTGTGVMIGLPYQTVEDLAGDIVFYRDHDIDMIGMGPYIVHKDTPLSEVVKESEEVRNKRFIMSLKMIALTRIVLKDVNIASTTALQALNPLGREIGFVWGANVIMPNVTPQKYREDYTLYEGKPYIDENSDDCKNCILWRAKNFNHEIVYFHYGDPPHYYERIKKKNNSLLPVGSDEQNE